MTQTLRFYVQLTRSFHHQFRSTYPAGGIAQVQVVEASRTPSSCKGKGDLTRMWRYGLLVYYLPHVVHHRKA